MNFSFFAVLNHWVHLTSVVVWIGGLAFQVFVAAPLLKAGDPSENFLKSAARRFRSLVGPLIIILIITGGINFGFRRAGYETVPSRYVTALGVKVFLVSIVASLYFFDLMRTPQDEEAAEEKRSEEPIPPGFKYSKITLGIGLIIIFLASMLRQWKF